MPDEKPTKKARPTKEEKPSEGEEEPNHLPPIFDPALLCVPATMQLLQRFAKEGKVVLHISLTEKITDEELIDLNRSVLNISGFKIMKPIKR